METDQIEQDDKKWDHSWTTDEIRKNSSNWTLAGDVGLYNLLNEFAQNIISRTHEVENAVDTLVYKTKMANAKINNIINDFHMLSNLQFVENRVYDEEISGSVEETKPVEKTKEQKEAEMLPKIIKAVELGLQVLDQAFNKINVNEISDSEDEDLSSEGRTILEPKDPYEHRPLPFIIGSEEFQNSDYAGLQDLLEEEADYSAEIVSSSSDSEDTSSDEEEPLPLDEDQFTGGPTQEKLIKRSVSDQFSSSEESELFGSEKDDNGFISDSSLDSKMKEDKVPQKTNEEVKPSKQSSISTLQSKLNLAQVLPTPKMQEKQEKTDLFVDDEASDDESPFRKKTGLFQSDLRFDEEKDMFDNDLFGDLPKASKKDSEKPKPTPEKPRASSVQKKKEENALFGNDEDSEDDIFKTLVTARKPTVTKDTSINRQESLEKGDSSSTPSSAPSSKPSGNAFNFLSAGGNSDSLFGDESDADDLFSTKKTQKTFGFDASQEDDDLFGLMGGKTSKKTETPTKDKKDQKSDSEKQSSLFEASSVADKPYKKIGQPLPGLVPVKTQETPKKETETPKSFMKIGQPLPGLVKNQAKDSIFDDSDSSSQEDKQKVKKLPPVKKRDSLFDDEDDDDIFSQAPAKHLSPGMSPSLINKPNKPQESETKPQITEKAEKKPPTPSLFDNDDDDDFGLIVAKTPSSTKTEKKPPAPSLFDNDDDDDFGLVKKPSLLSKTDKSKDLSLFEDSDNFDLFNPKPQAKLAKPASTLVNDSSEEDSIFKTSVKTDGVSPKKKVKETLVENSDLKISNKKENVLPIKTEPIQAMDEYSKAGLFHQTNEISFPKTEISASPIQSASSEDIGVGFDTPVDTSNTLHAINKDRARVSNRRRPPTKKGRTAPLESSTEKESSDTNAPKVSEPTNDLFESSPAPEPTSTSHKVQEKKKMNLMSQLMSEAATSKVGKRAAPVLADEDDDVDIFSEVMNKDRTKSRGFSFHEPIETKKQSEEKEEKSSLVNSEDGDNDDFFAEPSFKRTGAQSTDTLDFRNSFSHKDPILDLDDDDDDDLFSTIKSAPLKPKTNASTDPDIFADDTDIFAGLQKEKYEMFPSQLYDNEDDDIFGGLEQSSNATSSSKATSSVPVKKEVEKKPVFDDPLSGLLGED